MSLFIRRNFLLSIKEQFSNKTEFKTMNFLLDLGVFMSQSPGLIIITPLGEIIIEKIIAIIRKHLNTVGNEMD